MLQPYCPNELSPWARIRFADENREVETTLYERNGSAHKTNTRGSSGQGERSWKRRLSIAGSRAFGQSANTQHGFPQHKKELGLLNGDDNLNKSVKSTLQLNLPTRKHSRRSMTQGHTSELCWYMKTQELSGVAIPSDFSNCTIHPSPKDSSTPSSSSETSLDRNPQHSLLGSDHDASTISETSTTQSSTYIDTNATTSGKYIHTHSAKTAKHSRIHSRTSRTRTTTSKACTCVSHTCRTYLHSGKPTRHCQSCILPTPQPEIRTAIARINHYRYSANAVFENGAKTHILSAKELQEDLLLATMYQAEMEKRCEKGVWWEGWLVVRELEGRGVVGGK